MGLELLANRLEPHVARVAIVGRGAHLDQLARLEGAINLGHDLVGQPLVADEDGGLELVGLRAQLAAAPGGERTH